MERNKNVLIGGLLAIVLVMAVGYAAFATQLNINGTASITSSWNVHFDTTATSAYTTVTGTGGTTAPTATMNITNYEANLSANLIQPGDKVTYTLTVMNEGSIAATLSNVTLSSTGTDACTVSGLTCTKGNIKFTATNPASSSLAATNGSTTLTVVAEYIDTDTGGTSSATTQSTNVTVSFNATQA